MNDIDFLDKALIEADKQMKRNNGHRFVTMLKTRCQYCGKSPRQKGNCSYWFESFITGLKEVYLNKEKYLEDVDFGMKDKGEK